MEWRSGVYVGGGSGILKIVIGVEKGGCEFERKDVMFIFVVKVCG